MLIALAAGKGAPGVTTTALALTVSWPRPVLLVELDPRGTDIRLGHAHGARTGGRGLTMLREERRANLTSRLWENVIALGAENNKWWLPGVDHPRQARLMDWPKLADLFAEAGGLGVDVIADCGSVWTEKPPRAVWQASAMVGLVVRPTRAGTAAAGHAAEVITADLESGGLGVDRLNGIVVGGGSEVAPYKPSDVAEALPNLALLPSIDWDRRGADILNGLRDRRRRPSRLIRQAGITAQALLGAGLAPNQHGINQGPAAFALPAQTTTAPPPDASRTASEILAAPGPLVIRRPNPSGSSSGNVPPPRHSVDHPPSASSSADGPPRRPAVFKHAAPIPPPPPPPAGDQ